MAGIQIIHDRQKNIFIRAGSNIQRISAMCIWDGQLVLGSGADGAVYPNLQYADFDAKTESGIYDASASDWEANTISSEKISKNFDLGVPDATKQITRIVLFYRGNSDWSASGSITLSYRLDSGSWTSLGAETIATTGGLTVTSYRKLSQTPAYNIQLKLTSDDDFEVMKVMFYYQVLPVR